MPRNDIYHKTVIAALEKDGWVITDDPLKLSYGGRPLYVDLGAEQLGGGLPLNELPLGAERQGQKIAVEIKSFVGKSDVNDLENAIGQYRLYFSVLDKQESNRTLYLAIPNLAYVGIFSEPIGQLMLETQSIRLIVFDDLEEEIIKWIE